MVDKDILRQVYLEKRLFLSTSELKRRNQLLSNLLLSRLTSKGFSTVHLFMSMKKKNEVDTLSIMEAMGELNPSIQFVTSKTRPNGILEHYKINSKTSYELSKWGIPEPTDAEVADIGQIELVLIPLVIFDKAGHRIGYGKGYYDRFLKQVPNAFKVGVTLGPPLDKIDYVGEYDVPMNACCTPFEYYEF